MVLDWEEMEVGRSSVRRGLWDDQTRRIRGRYGAVSDLRDGRDIEDLTMGWNRRRSVSNQLDQERPLYCRWHCCDLSGCHNRQGEGRYRVVTSDGWLDSRNTR